MSHHLPTASKILQVVVFAVCLTLFAAQSYREIAKYFTKLTSTAIRTDNDLRPRHPAVCVCHKVPFKEDRLIINRSEYEERSWSLNETFKLELFQPSLNASKFEIDEIRTLWTGTCFLIRYNENVTFDEWLAVSVRNTSAVTYRDEHLGI